ncbi:hypothetical protein AMECASPLE_003945 [Ameca splendens]|uniref:Uncharacterized protein n=1 Tax=Ameca splendens TaxID=208324 RepID=A0ABV0YKS6_9TELE
MVPSYVKEKLQVKRLPSLGNLSETSSGEKTPTHLSKHCNLLALLGLISLHKETKAKQRKSNFLQFLTHARHKYGNVVRERDNTDGNLVDMKYIIHKHKWSNTFTVLDYSND